MPVYSLSPIYQPQFVAASAAGLIFAPISAAAGIVVPANYQYIIGELRVSNSSSSAATLSIWRVPKGSVNDSHDLLINTVTIPPATQTFAWYDVGALWGAVLMPGDAIWALAGTASALTVYADGVVGIL